LLFNPGAGGILPGSTSCGAVLHVPTQMRDEPDSAYPELLHDHSITNNITITENECSKEWILLKKAIRRVLIL